MPRNRALTKSQQDNIRRTMAQGASQIARRLREHAEGKVDMSNSQIKAAQIVLGKVIPDLQSTQFEDVTPQHGQVEDVKDAYRQLQETYLASLTPDDLEAMAQAKRQNLAS